MQIVTVRQGFESLIRQSESLETSVVANRSLPSGKKQNVVGEAITRFDLCDRGLEGTAWPALDSCCSQDMQLLSPGALKASLIKRPRGLHSFSEVGVPHLICESWCDGLRPSARNFRFSPGLSARLIGLNACESERAIIVPCDKDSVPTHPILAMLIPIEKLSRFIWMHS